MQPPGRHLESAPQLSLRGPALRAAVLGGMLVAIEGIDAFGISYVGPLIGAEARITPQSMGIVFAASVIASLLGAVGLAPLSDRFGRRRVLLAAGTLAALGTLLTPLAGGVITLFVLRLLVGLGAGTTPPVAIALVTEHAPPQRRALLGTLMNSSVVVGSILVAAGVAVIVPVWGWRTLMVSAGLVSLAGVLCAALWLPESPAVRAASVAAPDTQRAVAAAAAAAPGPLALLQPGHAMRSLLLLLQLTLSNLIISFAVFWQPALILALGYSISVAGTFGAVTQMFAVGAAFLVGWLMDRRGASRVLPFSYGLGAACFIAACAFASGSTAQLLLYLVGLSSVSASVSGSIAFTSGAYPPQLRATALGWITGLARLVGGTTGTVAGGHVVAAGWTTGRIIAVMGVMIVLATFALGLAIRAQPAAGSRPSRPSASQPRSTR